MQQSKNSFKEKEFPLSFVQNLTLKLDIFPFFLVIFLLLCCVWHAQPHRKVLSYPILFIKSIMQPLGIVWADMSSKNILRSLWRQRGFLVLFSVFPQAVNFRVGQIFWILEASLSPQRGQQFKKLSSLWRQKGFLVLFFHKLQNY